MRPARQVSNSFSSTIGLLLSQGGPPPTPSKRQQKSGSWAVPFDFCRFPGQSAKGGRRKRPKRATLAPSKLFCALDAKPLEGPTFLQLLVQKGLLTFIRVTTGDKHDLDLPPTGGIERCSQTATNDGTATPSCERERQERCECECGRTCRTNFWSMYFLAMLGWNS